MVTDEFLYICDRTVVIKLQLYMQPGMRGDGLCRVAVDPLPLCLYHCHLKDPSTRMRVLQITELS